MRLLERLTCAAWAAAAVVPLALGAGRAGASQPQFFEIEGAADFLAGELDGLSVDSDGHVSLAPAADEVFDTATPYVWSLLSDVKGTLYAGSGNEGQVFRVRDGKGEAFFKTEELEVHALALGPDGRLYVGSSPDGKVYAVDAKGNGSVFFDPPEKYIWGLAFDPQGRLLVATGAEARLHRVERDGRDEVLFTSPETHFTALAVDRDGSVYLGTAPGGVIVRVDPAGKAFVLADTAFGEVKSLDLGSDGTLYAALFAGDATAAASATPAVAPATATGDATVTISETFAVAPAVALPGAATTAGAAPTTGAGSARGAVLRLQAGDVETLWSSTDDAPHALVATGDGVLVGTGDKGKLFRVRDDQSWSMLAAFPAQQVTALARVTGGGVALATSNAGKLHLVGALPRARGTFTSAARDTGTVSAWGRVRFEARLPEGTQVQLETRSGNTQSPDNTWSDWAAVDPHAEGDAVKSPKARLLQVRANLRGSGGRSPLLDSLSAAYLQRNLRPQVTSLTVYPPGEVFQKPISVTGEIEVLGLDAPDDNDGGQAARNAAMAMSPYSRKVVRRGIQTLSWKAEDPNQDALVYDVSYRRVGDSRFRPLRQGLTDAVYAWDTTALPNGRYQVKVTARDTPANPPGLALAGEKESTPFEIDNTPPGIVAALLERSPARVRVTARDDGSLIRRAEYAVDGQRWVEVYPKDGINDSPEETYEITPAMPATPGPHIVVVRVTDLLGNVSSAQVEVP